jgi:hypothetical protein
MPIHVTLLSQLLLTLGCCQEASGSASVEVARLASQNVISGWTKTGDTDPKAEAKKFYDAGLPYALQPDYSEHGSFDNNYSGLPGAERITLVSNEAKSMKDANTLRFCATLPLGSAEHRSLCGSGGNTGTNISPGGSWPTNGVNIAQQCTLDSTSITNIINRYSAFIEDLGSSHLRDLAGIINNVAAEKGVNALLLASIWGEETYFSKFTGSHGLGCISGSTLSDPQNSGIVAAHVEEQARCIANTMNTTISESGRNDPLGQFQAFICRWATGQFSCTYTDRIARIVEGTARNASQTETRPGVLDFYDATGNSCGKI